MPRDGSNIWNPPAGTLATPATPIESAKYNAFVNDLTADLNAARPIVAGGTAATTAAGARTALGLAIGTDVQAYDADLAAVAGLSANGIVTRTGAGTAAARTITGTAGLITVTNGDGVSGNPTVTIANGAEGQILRSGASAPAMGAAINRATAVASTSGTSIDFTGIPSWARRITVALDGVSLSGTDILLLQIGDSGGIETTGYIAGAAHGNPAPEFTTATNAFPLSVPLNSLAADAKYGAVMLTNYSANSWVLSGSFHSAGYQVGNFCSGAKTLSGTLDRVRLLPSGANTFDGGVVNVLWE